MPKHFGALQTGQQRRHASTGMIFHSRPVSFILNRLSTLRSVPKLLDSPWLVLVARYGIRVFERRTPKEMLCTFVVVLICVLLWVMMHQIPGLFTNTGSHIVPVTYHVLIRVGIRVLLEPSGDMQTIQIARRIAPFSQILLRRISHPPRDIDAQRGPFRFALFVVG